MKLERYASAQDAARAAAEAAQIIRRNEAQNVTERGRWEHALAEVARLTSLEPVKADEPANNAANPRLINIYGTHPDDGPPPGYERVRIEDPEQVAAE